MYPGLPSCSLRAEPLNYSLSRWRSGLLVQMQNTSASETTFKWVVWGMVSGWRPKDGKTGFLFLNFFFLKKKKRWRDYKRFYKLQSSEHDVILVKILKLTAKRLI